ncbi:MAG: DUF2860 family protein [Candidatus Omnitrophica bacterium]|nr:DUF2860 family protein [Candidatus Omnitrophota bacterium]
MLDKQSEEELKSGIYQYRQENYDEALEILEKLEVSSPDSSIVSYYLGLTYKRMEDYVSAKKYLEASLTMKPKIKGALIELIDTFYRLDETEEAKKWIKVAEDEGVRPAQAAFLKGLTLLKADEYEGAVSAFKDAKSLDDSLTQSANFQIGICYMKWKKVESARQFFENIVIANPDADISVHAGRYVEALERKIEREQPLHLKLRFAFEYDTNVVLKPADTAIVTNITDQDDTRQVWDFRGDYTVKSPNDFATLKTGYALRISKQNDFGRYDMVINHFSTQSNFSFDKILVTFPVNYTHTVVDEKNYLSAVTAGNVNNIILARSQMAQLGIIYKFEDFLRPPFGAENREGNELMGTGGYFWFFAKNEGFFNIRYTISKDWAEGNNWQYWGNRATAVLLVPFWERFTFNLQGDCFFQFFDNINTVYGKKRKDQVYSLNSLLSYEIIKDTVELQLQYTYVNDQSNINIYKYDRQVVSCGVQYRF